MRKLLALFVGCLLVASAAVARAPEDSSAGRVALGVEQVDLDDDSAKYNEYRDRSDGLLLDELWYDFFRLDTGGFLELSGERIGRADQSLRLRAGDLGAWSLDVDWNETPHRLGNDARTPYDYRGNGLFDVSSNVPITFKKLATGAADAPSVVASDQLVATYLDANLRRIPLGTERNRGSMMLDFGGGGAFGAQLSVTDEQRSGFKVGYGPIGDRPPRTLNIQMPEPVDYRTRDAELRLEHDGDRLQIGFAYLVSDFENEIDTLTWENIFATPAPGSNFDVWDRAVSAYGQRPLAPDNQLHQATVDFGFATPRNGRLSGIVSYGRLDQDERLLPYSFADEILVAPDLPRSTAAAEMETLFAGLTYTSNPVENLHVRAFARYYDLANRTPESNWWYVTSDTSNLDGTRSYKNRRTNLAYAYDSLTFGGEAQWRARALKSTLTATLELEEIGREYREADTSESRLTVQWRGRPSERVSFKARYLYGDRDGDGYDGFVTRQSYWYSPAQAGTDNDNPGLTFSNHPDMRRYDVADRERNQFDLGLTWTPTGSFNVTAEYWAREDDYDSGVRPTQPLAGRALADAALFTPGDQLGLLTDDQGRASLNAGWAPREGVTLTAFFSLESADRRQRSLEFNENNKQNPSAVATAELGGWNRAASQWIAETEDEYRTLGAALDWTLSPDRATLRLDASWSRGTTEIEYSGFGVTNWNGAPFADDHQFGFRTPPTIENELASFGAELELRIFPRCDLVVGYGYDRYDVVDWSQEADTPWFESVGSEYLLRDTSRSHQWGNRLVNLGSYLAPGYRGHYGQVGLAIRF